MTFPYSQLTRPGWLKKVWKPQKVEDKLLYCSTFHHSPSGTSAESLVAAPRDHEAVIGALLGHMCGFWPEVLRKAEYPLASLPALAGSAALGSAAH